MHLMGGKVGNMFVATSILTYRPEQKKNYSWANKLETFVIWWLGDAKIRFIHILFDTGNQ